jgi:hypothetical protein
MIPEYFPWSRQTLSECIELQKKGLFPALDLELSAKCSGCSCIYCDSKPEVSESVNFDETKTDEIIKLLKESIPLGLKWVYTCGLGEPLEDSKFWDMLHYLAKHDVKLSMFSNGIFIQDIHTAQELKALGVSMILKMDTFDEGRFDEILGKPKTAQEIYAALDYLLSAGYAQADTYTDLAFSIVPTSLSIDGIPEVINYCKKYKIFASIGELEQAGAVIHGKLNQYLSLPTEKVSALKAFANEYYEGCYMRPICPCILTGLHINNKGDCIVDRITGLNCKWFLLKDPDTHLIGNIYNSTTSELFERVKAYRIKAFEKNREVINSSVDVSFVFGGCGGNPTDILKLYKEANNIT